MLLNGAFLFYLELQYFAGKRQAVVHVRCNGMRQPRFMDSSKVTFICENTQHFKGKSQLPSKLAKTAKKQYHGKVNHNFKVIYVAKFFIMTKEREIFLFCFY